MYVSIKEATHLCIVFQYASMMIIRIYLSVCLDKMHLEIQGSWVSIFIVSVFENMIISDFFDSRITCASKEHLHTRMKRQMINTHVSRTTFSVEDDRMKQAKKLTDIQGSLNSKMSTVHITIQCACEASIYALLLLSLFLS